jgi:hypothetical protein
LNDVKRFHYDILVVINDFIYLSARKGTKKNAYTQENSKINFYFTFL